MVHEWLRETANGVDIQVIVVPKASMSELVGIQEGRLKVRLAAPAHEGKANQELVRLMARALDLARAQVELVTGRTGKRKVLRILGTTREAVLRQLGKVIGDSA